MAVIPVIGRQFAAHSAFSLTKRTYTHKNGPGRKILLRGPEISVLLYDYFILVAVTVVRAALSVAADEVHHLVLVEIHIAYIALILIVIIEICAVFALIAVHSRFLPIFSF